MSNSVYPATPKFFYDVPRTPSFPVEVMETVSGREQRLILGPKRTTWAISYPLLSAADAATLEAFHDAHFGSGDSFLFNAPGPAGTVQTRVRFAAFDLAHVGGGKWRCSAALISVVS